MGFRQVCMFRAEEALGKIDFTSEEAVKTLLPGLVEGLDYKQRALLYPALMCALVGRGHEPAEVSLVFDIMFPTAEMKQAPIGVSA